MRWKHPVCRSTELVCSGTKLICLQTKRDFTAEVHYNNNQCCCLFLSFHHIFVSHCSFTSLMTPQAASLVFVPSKFTMHGCLRFCRSSTFCTVVSSSGRIRCIFLSVIFRCFHREACGESVTEPPCSWNRLTVWAWPECSVVYWENLCWPLILWRFLSWCCLRGGGCSRTVSEAVKSSQMIHVEFN